MTPTEAAVRDLCLSAARFRLTALALIEDGQPIEAEGALAYARLCERAAEAEDMDLEPVVGPDCTCFRCRWARLTAGMA